MANSASIGSNGCQARGGLGTDGGVSAKAVSPSPSALALGPWSAAVSASAATSRSRFHQPLRSLATSRSAGRAPGAPVPSPWPGLGASSVDLAASGAAWGLSQSGWNTEMAWRLPLSDPATGRQAVSPSPRPSPAPSVPSDPKQPSQSWLRSQGRQGCCHSTQARWLPRGLRVG